MSASSIYRSTDTSAPELIPQIGGLITLLDAVLVNGYGAKPGLGWTKEYSNTGNTIAVYRNQGTRTFLQIDNSNSWSGSQCQAKVVAYSSMLDYETGYLICPEEGALCYINIHGSYSTTISRSWDIIGDDKGFYIITQGTSVGLWMIAYFGDYVPLDPVNKLTFMMVFPNATNNVNISNWNTTVGTSTSTYFRVSHDGQNNYNVQQFGLQPGATRAGTGLFSNVGVSILENDFPIFETHYIRLNDKFIGMIPGFYEPVAGIEMSESYPHTLDGDIYAYGLQGGISVIGILVGEGFRC